MEDSFIEKDFSFVTQFTKLPKYVKVSHEIRNDKKFSNTFHYEQFPDQVKKNFDCLDDIFAALKSSRKISAFLIDGTMLLVRLWKTVKNDQIIEIPVKLYLFEGQEGEKLTEIKEQMKSEWKQELNREMLSELKKEMDKKFWLLMQEIKQVKKTLKEEKIEKQEVKKDEEVKANEEVQKQDGQRICEMGSDFDEEFIDMKELSADKQEMKIERVMEKKVTEWVRNKLVDEFDEEMNKFEEDMKAWRKEFDESISQYTEEITIFVNYQSGKYKGQTKNGKPHGLGLFLWKNGSQEERIEGQWKNGRLNGKAYRKSKFNIQYCEYQEGLMHGKQVIYSRLGGTCSMFENQNGYHHGKFRSHESDGTLVRAEFKYGQNHGTQKIYKADGTLQRPSTWVDGIGQIYILDC